MPKRTIPNALTYVTQAGDVLSPQESMFVKLYVESMGDSYRSILAAYKLDPDRQSVVARGMASENLQKPHILRAIREIHDAIGLTHEIVDTELAFVVLQKRDLNAKNKAIDIYNKMRGRYALDNKQKNFNFNQLLDDIESANQQGMANEKPVQDCEQEVEAGDIPDECDAAEDSSQQASAEHLPQV